jgi:16S rRNA (adenine1518-N6/adenine1519-N6)-dimethyltransferase
MSVSRRQTFSYLKQRFERLGLQPDVRHGQNFLIDLNLIELIARTGELTRRDVVLEVGTGGGSLTALMAEKAGHVLSFEIDPGMHQLASEELAACPNVSLFHQDALRNKNNLHPVVLDALDEWMQKIPKARLKLVANLPYNIATPVISNLLSTPHTPALMAVTIQKELADRLTAKPNSKDYGALSVWVQSQCSVKIARVLPPSVFWPRPKVTSAIVRIELQPDRRDRIPDRPFFHTFVRALFLHRRKYLRSCLVSAVKGELDKSTVDEILTEQGHGPEARTEQLSIERLLALTEAVRAKLSATHGAP